MYRRTLISLALALGLALTAACGSNNNGKTSNSGNSGSNGNKDTAKTLTLGSTSFNNHGTKAASGSSSVELEADNYYFEPTFVSGTPGQKLTLDLSNDSSTEHNLSVTALGVDTDIPAKGKATVTITFPSSGVLQFFCKYHTSSGMNGEFLVGDAQPQAPNGAAPAAPTQKSRSNDYGY